uniref:Putative secreted peptide n=1 Tax=Anopheles braziliensis TaxID=58242 RepID=A0A2M3ZVQ6_9DIPT
MVQSTIVWIPVFAVLEWSALGREATIVDGHRYDHVTLTVDPPTSLALGAFAERSGSCSGPPSWLLGAGQRTFPFRSIQAGRIASG